MDVLELHDFYVRPLGRMTGRLVGGHIRAFWPNVQGLNVAGFGYCAPFLDAFLEEAACVSGLMPVSQGAMPWPREGASRTALVSETAWPLEDECLDRLLLVHTVEHTQALADMLRQAWRVLKPEGRALVIVPNRRGLWARRETTPFGHGQPYTRAQLSRLVQDNLLIPVRWSAGLFFLPVDWPPLLRLAPAWERMGRIFWQGFAGVIVVEVSRQMYAGTPLPVTERLRTRMRTVRVTG